jgi:transposase
VLFCNYVSVEKGIEIKQQMDWVYKYAGAIGLLPRKNQSYSVAFKLNVLKAIAKRFIVFERFKLSLTSDTGIIFKWKKDFC